RRELLHAPGEKATVGVDQDRTNALLREGCEGRFEIAIGSGVHNNELQAERAAAQRSATTNWVDGAAGSTRTPNRAALDINSRSNCNRFGTSSAFNWQRNGLKLRMTVPLDRLSV